METARITGIDTPVSRIGLGTWAIGGWMEIEDSLRRLRTDRIDLYQVHWPDSRISAQETAGEPEKLRREGKILAIGVSNYDPLQMTAFRSFAPLSTVRSPYSLFERAIDADVLPYARQTGLTVMAYGALCRGLLSGRMRADRRFTGDDLRLLDPKFEQPRFAQYLSAAEALQGFAAERFGKSLLALAIRWILDQGPTIALRDARHPEQLEGVDAAFGWSLDAAALSAIDQLLEQHIRDPVGPEFMAPPA